MRYYAVKSPHYFNSESIKSIVEEIKRVLKINGYLVGRVNSINDINNYFSEFKIEVCQEESITKYIIEKKAFEFVAKK